MSRTLKRLLISTYTTTLSTHTDEKDLITRTQHGDTEAFNPLVRKYHPQVYHHILGNVRDPEAAKDLTRETFFKAFRAIKTYRGDSAFSSWLYRISENVCIDYFRKHKHDIALEPLHAIEERRITQIHPDPYRDLERQELRERLQAAIADLTPTRKQVFLLYYVEELPVKAIAMLLKRSEGTVKSHLRNAHLQLQEALSAYLKTDEI